MRYIPVLCMFFMVTLLGCGPKAPYDVVRLEGVATYAGQPIAPGFRLEFRPLDGKRVSTAMTKDGGSFVAAHTAHQDGISVGNHQVTIQWDPLGPPVAPEYAPMLEKYGYGTEGLKIEITKPDKKYKLDFPE